MIISYFSLEAPDTLQLTLHLSLVRYELLSHFSKCHKKTGDLVEDLTMKISKPIVVIGIERSGKTLLVSILANHPSLYWLSNLDSRWPAGTIPVTLARRIFSWTKIDQNYVAIPGTKSTMQGRFPPSECVTYWKRVFRWGTEENYLIEDDYFDENDLRPELKKRLVRDFNLRVSLSGKARLILEQAGFSLKVLFFNALFPDAIFLQTIRNPFENHDSLVRAKRNSNQKFWGVKIPGWKELINADLSKQAVMQIRSALEIIDQDIVKIPNFETRFLRIRYEDLVSMPQQTIQSVLDFCDLDMAPQVLAALSGVRNEEKQQRNTSDHKSPEILDVLNSLAYEYGYLNTEKLFAINVEA